MNKAEHKKIVNEILEENYEKNKTMPLSVKLENG